MELVPDFYDDFHCQCGACSYTCCQEWSIEIHQEDYEKLMSLAMPEEDRALLQSTFVLNKQQGGAYAHIEFRKDGKCGFYGENGLCRLQGIVGEAGIPHVCRQFPRVSGLVFGTTFEKCYRLDCPAVTELLLERTQGLQFLTRPTQETPTKYLVGRLKGHKHKAYIGYHNPSASPSYVIPPEAILNNPLMQYYWELKTLLIGVLQNREHTIHQRLLYMGVLLRALLKLELEGKIEEAGALINEEMERSDFDDIMSTLERLPRNDPIALDWVGNLLSLRTPYFIQTDSVREETIRLLRRLGARKQEDGKFIISRSAFTTGRKNFAEYCDAHPHVAENIAVTLFQIDLMPFACLYKGDYQKQKYDLWRNYRWYCIQFAAWQLFMRARFVEGTPDEREIARLTSVVFRKVPNVAEKMEEYEKKLTSGVIADPLEIISILIK